jgi:excisionase family DNA binding protein
MNMLKELFTTKDVAEYLRTNERQIYLMLKKKKIPATRVTGKWLFPKILVDDWIMFNARGNIEDYRRQQ